jgi:hypothetical protein
MSQLTKRKGAATDDVPPWEKGNAKHQKFHEEDDDDADNDEEEEEEDDDDDADNDDDDDDDDDGDDDDNDDGYYNEDDDDDDDDDDDAHHAPTHPVRKATTKKPDADVPLWQRVQQLNAAELWRRPP